MAEKTEPNAHLNEPFGSVADEEYDGRSFTSDDNKANVSSYVGVDPIYQNYANEGEKPYPFSEDELVAAAERAGLQAEEVWVGGEDDEDDEDDESDDQKSETKAPAPAPAPEPVRPASTQRATTSRASAKDGKSADGDKK